MLALLEVLTQIVFIPNDTLPVQVSVCKTENRWNVKYEVK